MRLPNFPFPSTYRTDCPIGNRRRHLRTLPHSPHLTLPLSPCTPCCFKHMQIHDTRYKIQDTRYLADGSVSVAGQADPGFCARPLADGLARLQIETHTHTHTPHTHTHALKHTLKYTLAITGCGYASAGKFKFNNCRTLYNSMEEEKDGQQGVGGKGRGRR